MKFMDFIFSKTEHSVLESLEAQLFLNAVGFPAALFDVWALWVSNTS